jgi:HrpA-like RNA helicase
MENRREYLSRKRENDWGDDNQKEQPPRTQTMANPFLDADNNDILGSSSKGGFQSKDNSSNRGGQYSRRNSNFRFDDLSQKNYYQNNKQSNVYNKNNFYQNNNEKNYSQKPNHYNKSYSNNKQAEPYNVQIPRNPQTNSQKFQQEQDPNEKKRLPIEKHRDIILNYIKTNQVIVIAGETGCGKTTQVPKYIYEDYLKRNDKKLNMIITQPRRIAAVSIAKRLCEELNIGLGKEVGYHVGRSPVFDSDKTKILIVTTGIFLQRLIHEKELPEISHVILDEVHERDIDIDFVMILIKHILRNHPNLKLILMSATISTELFANYFSKDNIEKIEDADYYRNLPKNAKKEAEEISGWDNLKQGYCNNPNINIENSWSADYSNDTSRINHEKSLATLSKIINSKGEKEVHQYSQNQFINSNDSTAAPVIKIEEKLYPIKIEYLKEILQNYIDPNFVKQLPTNLGFDKNSPRTADYIFDIAAMLIQKLHKLDHQKNFFSILVFLPGLYEIQFTNEKILNYMEDDKKDLEILFLHSGMSE